MKKRPVVLTAEKESSEKAVNILRKVGQVIEFGSRKNFFANLPKAEVIIAGLEVKFHKDNLDRAKKLRLIASRTTQMRHIDFELARKRGIAIINIKGNSRVLKQIPSTAEETFALLLALVRNIPWAHNSVLKEKWG